MTRPLNADERAVLRRVLEGNRVLLAQVDQAEVVSSWSPGSVSVDLTVPDAIPDGDLSGVYPRRALMGDSGEIIVWVTRGVLSGLECTWHVGDPPVSLPDPAAISFTE